MKTRSLAAWVLGIVLGGILVGVAALPVKSNVVTVDIDRITGAWDSFDWRWAAAESQSITVRVVASSTPQDLSSTFAGYRMVRQDVTGTVTYLNATNVTIATSNLTVSLSYTNVPPPGVYLMEFYGWDAGTNSTRTYAQGRVTVYRSLYD